MSISSHGTVPLLMFITPVFNTGSTGKNDKLIRLIENELQKAEKEYPQLVAEYFGGPSVGVYNARQIKKDTLVTSSIALIIIIVFISLVFKHKKSIPLIITRCCSELYSPYASSTLSKAAFQPLP